MARRAIAFGSSVTCPLLVIRDRSHSRVTFHSCFFSVSVLDVWLKFMGGGSITPQVALDFPISCNCCDAPIQEAPVEQYGEQFARWMEALQGGGYGGYERQGGPEEHYQDQQDDQAGDYVHAVPD
ncbi:hypothetical protein ES703_125522 [subsurface metagenome]